MTLVSRLPPPKRERDSQGFNPSKAHTLECQDCGSSYRAKDLRCTRPPDYSNMFFTVKN